jgi:hypothetical protein
MSSCFLALFSGGMMSPISYTADAVLGAGDEVLEEASSGGRLTPAASSFLLLFFFTFTLDTLSVSSTGATALPLPLPTYVISASSGSSGSTRRRLVRGGPCDKEASCSLVALDMPDTVRLIVSRARPVCGWDASSWRGSQPLVCICVSPVSTSWYSVCRD